MKLGFRVEARRTGHPLRHQPVGAYDPGGFLVLDEQMVTARIVLVFVAARAVRGLQAFPELQVEDLEAQPLRRFDVVAGPRESRAVRAAP
jgi:hypothetical protein